VAEQLVGTVTHYFPHAGVIAIEVTGGELQVGDTIHVTGHTTDFAEMVGSLQIEHAQVQSVKKGDLVGIKVVGKARQGDRVLRVTPA
jgi:translation elongation factor EF-1alpha